MLVPPGIIDQIRSEATFVACESALADPRAVTVSIAPVGTKERIGLAVTVTFRDRLADRHLEKVHERVFAVALTTSDMWIGPGVAISVVIR